MSVIEKSVDVDVPLSVAYNQWTQFEDFPHFMEGVEEVRQLDDATLEWRVKIGGSERSFQARIEEQEPDRRVAWRATEGEEQAGVVTFQPVGDAQTRVHVKMTYEPERWTEKVADALNLLDRRVEGDLERFKSFIEERGTETGSWRGEVEHGDVQSGGESSSGMMSGSGMSTESGMTSESGESRPTFGDEPTFGGTGDAPEGGEPHDRR